MVVVPAYEEEATVASVVASVPPAVAGLATTCLVVDDGSADATSTRASEAGALVCRLPVNRGQGAALRVGYRLAADLGGRYVVTLDADGQWDAGDLEALVDVVASGRAELVSGTRRGGEDSDAIAVRRAGVVVFAAVIRLLTGAPVTDPANGLRAMAVEVPAAIGLEQDQFQSAELIIGALAEGFRYAEVPVRHHPRAAGRSKKGSSLAYGLRFARVIGVTYVRKRGWRHRRAA
ncbi:MAG TPA: glycosyltransferase family 2 protein [Acidimicrobiales bacterium]|nr:glycosyltransferase family 2 protein [Acidimicrobiales bacterium]